MGSPSSSESLFSTQENYYALDTEEPIKIKLTFLLSKYFHINHNLNKNTHFHKYSHPSF